jgi:hypothetical protein
VLNSENKLAPVLNPPRSSPGPGTSPTGEIMQTLAQITAVANPIEAIGSAYTSPPARFVTVHEAETAKLLL